VEILLLIQISNIRLQDFCSLLQQNC